MMEEKRDFYRPSEIASLLEQHNKPKSSFYRLVKKGVIKRVIRENEEVYDGLTVSDFLAGKIEGGGRKGTGVKRSSSTITNQEGVIDVARDNDLYFLYGLEIDQLGFLDAVASNVSYRWLQVNDRVYWIMFDPKDRRKIYATLSVLPLNEEVIQRLLRKEITPSQISPNDILSYSPDLSCSVYIASASAQPERKDAVMSLMKHLFSYWCEQSISIQSIYASVVDSTEDTPLIRALTHCFFVPLNHEKEQWELRPFERSYQISFIKDYQKCLLEDKKRKESSSMIVMDRPKTHSLDELRRIYQKSLVTKGREDYTEKVHEVVEVDANGYVTRRDGNNQRRVWVGPVRNDDDVRATLRINASLFGPSKKYTEDQLVGFRQAWLDKNPDIYRVLEINGEVLGFIFAMPLPMRVINRILLGEIKVGDVSAEDLVKYQPGGPPVDVYLQTLGLHKSFQGGDKVFAGSYLIAGMERLIADIGERGVEVGSIFTRSDEPDGLRLLGRLGFDEMPNLSERVGKLVFQLNFSQDKPSLRAYKRGLESYKSNHRLVEGTL